MKRSSLGNKFRRKAGRYPDKFVTKLWDDATESEKKSIASKVTLVASEQIFMCFIPGDTYWWLVTSERLIVFENELLNLIPLKNITADINGLTKEMIQNPDFKQQKEKRYPLLVEGDKKTNLLIEERAWYVVTAIFRFIFSSNYDKSTIEKDVQEWLIQRESAKDKMAKRKPGESFWKFLFR